MHVQLRKWGIVWQGAFAYAALNQVPITETPAIQFWKSFLPAAQKASFHRKV